jgi:Holliday junction resolvase-like predicted endonuclease
MIRIKKIIGEFYENKAIIYLQNQGYRIIDTNIYFKHKEIDILCRNDKEDMNVIVEVKYKNITLEESVFFINLFHKKKYLYEILESGFLETKYNLTGEWRVDFILFTNNGMEHFYNI